VPWLLVAKLSTSFPNPAGSMNHLQPKKNEKALFPGPFQVERAGIEPATSGLQSGAASLAAPLVSWLG
jgi:hypothetical protein